MRKINKFLTTLSMVGLATTALTPVMVLTGCSKTLLEQVKQRTISEFKELCKIPHPSDKFLYEVPYKSNVMKMSNYLQDRVQKIANTKVWQDRYGNIWFDVPYNDESLKNVPTVALQAHMDMVFSFDSSKYAKGQEPDPLTTSIDVVEDTVDGKKVLHTRDYKTSMGADNGIGVAQILAIISNKNVKHGNLRCIITNCEENAMQGAKMLIGGHTTDEQTPRVFNPTDPHVLDGVKYMINIDGEDEGEIVTACSGGVGLHYSNNFDGNNVVDAPKTATKYTLTVDGFTGGHSGDAPAEHLGNALIIANEIIEYLNTTSAKQIQLASIATPGTTVYNVVPDKCVIEFVSNSISDDEFTAAKNYVESQHNNESTQGWNYYKDMKKDKWTLGSSAVAKVLTTEVSTKLISLHKRLGYGVINWDDIGKATELKTSRNIAPCTLALTSDGKMSYKLSTYSRSDDADRVEQFKAENITAAKFVGLNVLCDAIFPSWKGDSNQTLANLTGKAWKEAGLDESKIKKNKIHGGIECAWWAKAMKDISKTTDAQCTSYGPTIKGCHKPAETLYLDTLDTCIKATLYILENIK